MQTSLMRYFDLEIPQDIRIRSWFQPFGHLWYSVESANYVFYAQYCYFEWEQYCTSHNINSERRFLYDETIRIS